MKATKDIRKEIAGVKSGMNSVEKRLKEIQNELLLNIECEKAGDSLPYDYQKLHTEAQTLRTELTTLPETLSDNSASFVPTIFPTLKGDNKMIKVGTRINWHGKLKRASVDLWDTEENNPYNSPTLWEDIIYKTEYRVIPEIITQGMAFSKDEMGWWGNTLYKSVIDGNVWTPDAYPSGWEVVEK